MAEAAPEDVAAASVRGAEAVPKPAVVESIDLGPKVSLVLKGDTLAVLDKSPKKSSRTSCPWFLSSSSGSNTTGSHSIALYNILWAELSPDSQTLNIDFAQEASKSKLRAAKLSYPVPPIASLDTINAFISTLISRSYGAAQNRKRAYVLVNPNAGPGGADRVFSREARPIFEAARMDLTVVTTTYAGEAGKLAEEMDVDAFDVVVACSGDGLPHEIFNGLGRRRDARRALGRTAVAMIPCGSGNAMAINLYGTHDPSLSALAIVKGVRTPFDLVSVTQGEERRLSFLSQALGLVAVLDITTENMRWLGSHRFTLGFLKEVLQKNLYPCDIAVKVEIEHKEGVKEHYKNKVLENNGYGNAEEGAGKSDRDSETTRMGTPGQDEEMGLPPLRYGTVRDKLPEGWELIPHEKLWSFYCGNMAYMSPGTNFFSAAMVNDGLMDLITIDGPVPPLKAIDMQLGVETGHFFDNPFVKYRKVSAYRIIPRTSGEGVISIDGERVPFEPFQAEVHHALALTLSKSGAYEAPGPKHWDKVTVSERSLP